MSSENRTTKMIIQVRNLVHVGYRLLIKQQVAYYTPIYDMVCLFLHYGQM